MRQYRFLTCDVFTDTAFGGNPLAVVPDAAGLDDRLMQAIAAEFNLSETIFVLPPADPAHTAAVRIFTPATELPFAGHPTVGCALVLAALAGEDGAEALVLEEKAGAVPVALARDAATGRPLATFTAPRLPVLSTEGLPPAPVLAAVLGLEAGEVLTRLPLAPAVCSAGVPFCIVPVEPQAIGRIRLNPALWEAHLQAGPAPHLYAVALDDPQRPQSVRARMFAPAMGIAEDPATGAAATALAAWLDRLMPAVADDTVTLPVVQGVEMGRPSTMHLAFDRRAGTLAAVRLGGTAVMVSEGTLAVPD